ncbi:peptidoglycan-associated lipoprotein [Allochromatium warmingii]|uniref:Peptidoglycan-associated lipoprotein n=1 Tax=Allochromatium warmingii TaxID=61595 RepID=A0A1H3GEK2_ALLWA|nr:peptidoglycan-associated lipoprotein Pal [Allochromatium warmingii]SDY01490.1 peptidoglycan-associated lipoprotein [Allochromatium warmingii]
MFSPRTALLLILLGAGLSGCATPPKPVAAKPVPTPPPQTREAPPPPVEVTRPTYAGPWEDPTNPLYQRTIYFDYNTAELKPESVALMRTHARYLGAQSKRRVTLEGHTDERGTREYNLALGDQRAEAVRRFMLAEGVPTEQLTTLSYGEERPADAGHRDAAWRLNRRVMIQY